MFSRRTTGTPIALLIRNTDQRSKDYSQIKDVFRPAHADYTYEHKYGIRDYRGGGRSSARETAMRVAAGAIAKKFSLYVFSYGSGCLTQLGPITCAIRDWSVVDSNPFFCPDPDRLEELDAFMTQLRRDEDSIGARLTVVAEGLPPAGANPFSID